MGFLLSVRDEADRRADPLGLADALGGGAVTRLELGPLSVAALHGMFLARLGHSFPRLTLARIAETSGGNPFYALEVAHALERSGGAEPGQPLPVSTTLAALVGERVAALPARTRKALVLAAAAFEPTLETLTRAGAEPDAALRPAVAAGIVRLDGDDRPLQPSAARGRRPRRRRRGRAAAHAHAARRRPPARRMRGRATSARPRPGRTRRPPPRSSSRPTAPVRAAPRSTPSRSTSARAR